MADIEDVCLAGIAIAGFCIIGSTVQYCHRKHSRRSVWVKPWIRVREIHGAYNTLFSDLINTDAASFQNYMRMNLGAFEELLSRVENQIQKQRTRFRRDISPRERLCLTIRYLATGKNSTLFKIFINLL
jgi:hypothetical protein